MSDSIRSRPGHASRPPLFRLGAVPALCIVLAGCGGGQTDATSGSRAGPSPPIAAPVVPAGPANQAPATVEGDRLAGTIVTAAAPRSEQEPSPFRFTEVARQSGVDFVHFSGMTRDKHFPT